MLCYSFYVIACLVLVTCAYNTRNRLTAGVLDLTQKGPVGSCFSSNWAVPHLILRINHYAPCTHADPHYTSLDKIGDPWAGVCLIIATEQENSVYPSNASSSINYYFLNCVADLCNQ